MSSLQVTTLILGSLDTNCYLVWDELSHQAIIIDPADDGTSINDQILNLQLQPQAIVLTHGHFDHVLATLEVKTAWNIPILMHASDQQLLARANSSALHWTGEASDPVPPADDLLKDEQTLNLGKSTLKVIHTPGHTPGSICLYDKQIIFTGDTIFKEGVGRTDFSYSSSKKLWQSIEKIKALGTKLAYAGHGEVFFT
jgi:glyoxylase-like metal-dependent hydrolase (beta-lactamase superfamily II)